MKNLFLSLAVSCLFLSNLFAQKEINLSLKYEAILPEEMANTLPANSTKITILCKGDNVLVNMLGMTTTITDYKKNLSWLITDFSSFGGEKTLIEMNLQDYKNMQGACTYEFTGETKQIMGYNAQKVIMTLKMPDLSANTRTPVTSEIWVTTELGKFNNPNYQDLDGVMLEMSVPVMNNEIPFKITEIKKGVVKDSDFNLPKGVKKVSISEYLKAANINEDDFKKMMEQEN